MHRHRNIIAAAGILLIGTAFAYADGLTVKQVTSAKTGKEPAKMGASQLSAADFKKRVIGKEMTEVGNGWNWVISADGTTQSAASDGSWSDDSKWTLKGNAYCREVEGAEKCSDIYMIGSYLRMTEDGNGTLSGWIVKLD